MSRSDAEKNDIASVQSIQRAAYVLIFSICGLTLVVKRDDITLMWSLQSGLLLQSVLQIALFLCAIGVVIRWIAATAHEFQLWLRNLHYVFIRSQCYVAMLGLAVVLGMMLILVYNIVAFTAFFSCYLLFSYWTLWVANEHFERAANLTSPSEPTDQAILQVLRRYWIHRPQLARIATMMFVSLLAFAFALRETGGGPHSQLFGIAAYLTTILNIVIGEAIISWWRVVRDRELQSLVDQPRPSSASDASTV